MVKAMGAWVRDRGLPLIALSIAGETERLEADVQTTLRSDLPLGP